MVFNANVLCSIHFPLIRCFVGRCKCRSVGCDKELRKFTSKQANIMSRQTLTLCTTDERIVDETLSVQDIGIPKSTKTETRWQKQKVVSRIINKLKSEQEILPVSVFEREAVSFIRIVY